MRGQAPQIFFPRTATVGGSQTQLDVGVSLEKNYAYAADRSHFNKIRQLFYV